jgi:hypothetical protein
MLVRRAARTAEMKEARVEGRLVPREREECRSTMRHEDRAVQLDEMLVLQNE